MRTLLEETTSFMDACNRGVRGIDWIGSSCGRYTVDWDGFVKLADREYFSGHGVSNVALDLVIVFQDGTWFSRWEYDGAEGWEYNRTPVKRRKTRTITKLLKDIDSIGISFESIEDFCEDHDKGGR